MLGPKSGCILVGMRIARVLGAFIVSLYGWDLWWLYTAIPPWRSVWYDPLYALTLVTHEAGHFVFLPFGGLSLIAVLGGSLLQWLVPLMFVIYFGLRKKWFAVGVTGVWWAASILNSVPYIADAEYRALPLIADGLIHDWNFILLRWNLLGESIQVARVVRGIGLVVLVGGLFGTWFFALKSGNNSEFSVIGRRRDNPLNPPYQGD